MNEVTNIEIVQLLADGFKVKEISEKLNVDKRMLETRIIRLRIGRGCPTVSNLVAEYIRKKLID